MEADGTNVGAPAVFKSAQSLGQSGESPTKIKRVQFCLDYGVFKRQHFVGIGLLPEKEKKHLVKCKYFSLSYDNY